MPALQRLFTAPDPVCMMRAFLLAAARRTVILAHKKKADLVFFHSIAAFRSP